jgi:protein disulfide-isomerase A6
LRRYGITGYPSLKFFPAGSSEPESYDDHRELESLVEFINNKVGTQRRPDGSLLPTAGRAEALDAILAAADYQVTIASLQAAVTEGGAGETGAEYLATARKVLAKGGAAYVAKELGRLDSMIGGSSIVPEKKAAFQLRRNILAAFQGSA